MTLTGNCGGFLLGENCEEVYAGVDATSDFAGLLNADKVSSWAEDGMSWTVGAGLISGVENNGVKDLAPQGHATRAQMATILQRFL